MQNPTPFDHRAQRAVPGRATRRLPRCLLASTALALFALLPMAPLRAAVQEQTPDGIAFMEGGIGADEVGVMLAQRSAYSLAIRLAAERSGAYIADAQLRILDAAGKVRFEREVHAPWLLIDLPPGRYVIEAVHDSEVRRRTLTIAPRDHREAVLYFTVPGETRPHDPKDD